MKQFAFLVLLIGINLSCFAMQPSQQIGFYSYTIKASDGEFEVPASDIKSLIGLKGLADCNKNHKKDNHIHVTEFDKEALHQTIQYVNNPHIYAKLISKQKLPEILRIANYGCADLRILKLLAKRTKTECTEQEIDPQLHEVIHDLNNQSNTNLLGIKIENGVLVGQGLGIDNLDGIEKLLCPEQRATITKINLSHNGFTQAPSNLLELFHNVKYIDLSYNAFTSFPRNLIVNLPQDAHLNLAHNFIDTTKLSKGFSNGLCSLDISFNQLSKEQVQEFIQNSNTPDFAHIIRNNCAKAGIDHCNTTATVHNMPAFKWAMGSIAEYYGAKLYQDLKLKWILKATEYYFHQKVVQLALQGCNESEIIDQLDHLSNIVTTIFKVDIYGGMSLLFLLKLGSTLGSTSCQTIMNSKPLKIYHFYHLGIAENAYNITNKACSGIATISQKLSTFLSKYTVPFKSTIVTDKGQYPTPDEIKCCAMRLKIKPSFKIFDSNQKRIITRNQIKQ